MGNASKFSIIIPMFNAENTIGHLLDCLVAQTYKNFEVVIVNDHSTDKCLEICRNYEEQLPMVLIDLPENKGVSNARNIGINHASGEYLLFIDSDDYVTPTYIEHVMTSELDDYVASGYTKPGWDSAPRGQDICVSTDTYRMNCFDMWSQIRITNVWAVRYKAELIRTNQIRFEESMRWGEDTMFNVHYLSCCKTMRAVGYQDYVYCANTTSLSKRYEPTRHDDAVKVAKALSEFITSQEQRWKIMFIYWEMSAKHYLNHRHDPMDAETKMHLYQYLSRSEREPFFREYIPYIINGGTLDMKLFAVCLKYRCSILFPALNRCLNFLANVKNKLLGTVR